MNREFLNKRFDGRIEQIEKLMVYAELMGLTGADLVSIGNKMKRRAENRDKERNLDAISNFVTLPIGQDKDNDWVKSHRFKLKTELGSYNFYNRDYGRWDIQSCSTDKKITHWIKLAEFPRSNYRIDQMRSCLLDIAENRLLLNF